VIGEPVEAASTRGRIKQGCKGILTINHGRGRIPNAEGRKREGGGGPAATTGFALAGALPRRLERAKFRERIGGVDPD